MKEWLSKAWGVVSSASTWSKLGGLLNVAAAVSTNPATKAELAVAAKVADGVSAVAAEKPDEEKPNVNPT